MKKIKENEIPLHTWGEKMGGSNQEPNLGSKTPSTHLPKMIITEIATQEFHIKHEKIEG